MWFNRPTTDRNYSCEQKVNFESPVLFAKCLRAKIYCNMNVHFDPQGCQTLLLKESEPFLLSLGSWTISHRTREFDIEWHTSSSQAKDTASTMFPYAGTSEIPYSNGTTGQKHFSDLSTANNSCTGTI